MAGGLALTGIGLLLMGGLSMNSEWTALLLGFIVSGIGIGLSEPGDRRRRAERRPEREKRHGGRHQRHLPPGRRRGRHRGLRGDLPRRRRLEGGVADRRLGRPRPGPGLVEATSSGALPQALRGIPANARDSVRNATEQGFLHGLNEILLIGGILCLVGTAFALWLVREREIDRGEVGAGTDAPLEAEPVPAQADPPRPSEL